jgi:hypothetical protein
MFANDQEALQPRSTLSNSNATPGFSELTSVIRDGLFALATLYGRDINPAWVPLWLESLKDLSPQIVEMAFIELGKTFIPTAAAAFPAPAHLRNVIARANEKIPTLKAEHAWQELLDWIRTNYHPDLGIDRKAPELDALTWHAAKAAGGLRHLWECPTSELQWAKKRFIEYVMTARETGKAEHLLTDAEAKQLIASLRSGPVQLAEKRLENET